MNQYDEEILNTFNECYPFERYIFTNPVKINELFDDLYITEIFVPSTEIKPIVSENGQYIGSTNINEDDIYVKVKGCAGEMRLSYFDFSDTIRENIRDNFIDDFGPYNWEMFYVESEDKSELAEKIKEQQNIIVSKYGHCTIKENVKIESVVDLCV